MDWGNVWDDEPTGLWFGPRHIPTRNWRTWWKVFRYVGEVLEARRLYLKRFGRMTWRESFRGVRVLEELRRKDGPKIPKRIVWRGIVHPWGTKFTNGAETIRRRFLWLVGRLMTGTMGGELGQIWIQDFTGYPFEEPTWDELRRGFWIAFFQIVPTRQKKDEPRIWFGELIGRDQPPGYRPSRRSFRRRQVIGW